MSPDHEKVAVVLAGKARGDLRAAQGLMALEDQADHAVGLHLQQAVEKALKVVLAAHEIEIPHSHNLQYLVGQVESAGIEVPEEVRSAVWLTPWAVVFRYDDDAADLDRDAGLEAAAAAVTFAEQIIEEERR